MAASVRLVAIACCAAGSGSAARLADERRLDAVARAQDEQRATQRGDGGRQLLEVRVQLARAEVLQPERRRVGRVQLVGERAAAHRVRERTHVHRS